MAGHAPIGLHRTHARGAGEQANARSGGVAMHVLEPGKQRNEQFTHALVIVVVLATVLIIGGRGLLKPRPRFAAGQAVV